LVFVLNRSKILDFIGKLAKTKLSLGSSNWPLAIDVW
jgi:hypothetical protein